MKSPIVTFNTPPDLTPEDTLYAVEQSFGLVEAHRETTSRRYYDTFDWLLYKSNRALVLYDDQLRLLGLEDEQTHAQCALTTVPAFAWDLPENSLREQIAPVTEVRALLEQAVIHVQETTYRVLNKNEKTVVWLTYQEISGKSEEKTIRRWKLKPLRGYKKPYRALQRVFEVLDCTTDLPTDFATAVDLCGVFPGFYSAKSPFLLHPTMHAAQATKSILRSLLNVIRINAPYIEKDIDTEFLHDFRVAVRRTRSALGQVNGVFPDEVAEAFKQRFAEIQKETNVLRDLDVYLLEQAKSAEILPPLLRPFIVPLFNRLKKNRNASLVEVSEMLRSQRFANLLESWEIFLEEITPPDPTAPNARRPIEVVAQESIYERYQRLLVRAEDVLPSGDPRRLHTLRIDCKKLRYLLEFFEVLFPPEDIKEAISHLKKLQTRLGTINDLHVQEQYLLSLADTITGRSKNQRQTLLAIGGLIATLHVQLEEEKQKLPNAFTLLSSKEARKLYANMFAPKEVAP